MYKISGIQNKLDAVSYTGRTVYGDRMYEKTEREVVKQKNTNVYNIGTCCCPRWLDTNPSSGFSTSSSSWTTSMTGDSGREVPVFERLSSSFTFYHFRKFFFLSFRLFLSFPLFFCLCIYLEFLPSFSSCSFVSLSFLLVFLSVFLRSFCFYSYFFSIFLALLVMSYVLSYLLYLCLFVFFLGSFSFFIFGIYILL